MLVVFLYITPPSQMLADGPAVGKEAEEATHAEGNVDAKKEGPVEVPERKDAPNELPEQKGAPQEVPEKKDAPVELPAYRDAVVDAPKRETG